MTRWGTAVLDRLPLTGDETVLDAACGNGRAIELPAEPLPDGRVIALAAAARPGAWLVAECGGAGNIATF